MRATVVMLAVLAACTACGGGGGGDAPAPSANAETWADISRSLTPGQDSGAANVCTRGDPSCLVAVLAEMDERLERLAATCDHAAPFAFEYREVTAAVADAGPGFFDEPETLAHLDAVFADLYFDARDAWQAGRAADVPEAWRITFEAGDDRRVAGIGDMLLGMNAHISRDLPFALAAIRRGGGSADRADFDRVNEILRAVEGPMLEAAARRFDPTIDDFAIPVLDVDDETVAALIAEWRREAWTSGERLVSARTAAERESVERAIETRAALRARLIRSATGYVPFLTSTRTRDEHCRAARPR